MITVQRSLQIVDDEISALQHIFHYGMGLYGVQVETGFTLERKKFYRLSWTEVMTPGLKQARPGGVPH